MSLTLKGYIRLTISRKQVFLILLVKMALRLTRLALALILCVCVSEISARNVPHQIPLAPKTRDLKYFWYPKDDGTGFVPAFLEGSPKETLADERDVKFYLFTPRNQNDRQQLHTGNLAALDASNYDRNAPIKIVSHGFSSNSVGGSAGTLKDAFVRKYGNVNVILVDWGPLAAAPWYDRAAANTRLVGAVTARFVEFLVDNNRASLSQITFIGHSLGAHVCGFIGSGLLVGKPDVIVALDPALPLFGGVSDEGRIDPSDAKFVQVIHTSGGPLTSGELAFMEPRGDADFYPNGGRNQPGCSGLPEVVGACSHSRAYEFYAESIHTNQFSSCKCPSWENFNNCDCGSGVKMGDSTPGGARGYFHLRTNGSPPYAQG